MDVTFSTFLGQIVSNPVLAVTVILALGAIFVNGWTDAPNAIATCVTTRCMPARAAILMSAAFNFLGVLIMTHFNASVANTISHIVDFGGNSTMALACLCAALFSIVVYGATASRFGIPTSQSHSLIAGLTGADNAQQRTAGFEEELAKYPDIEIVATQYCDWDTQKAQAAAEDIITANPDLKAFLVQDDGMSKGVWNAIEAAGKQDQIIIASQGFYEWSIPYLKEGKFAFTITYPAGFFARDAMDTIKAVSDGETVERVQWLGMELVTAENADTAAHD